MKKPERKAEEEQLLRRMAVEPARLTSWCWRLYLEVLRRQRTKK